MYSNGDLYTGAWKDDMADGYGILTCQHGMYRYEGTWCENYKHGIGKEYFADGTVYEGEFVYNNKEGKGKYLSPRGFEDDAEGNNDGNNHKIL